MSTKSLIPGKFNESMYIFVMFGQRFEETVNSSDIAQCKAWLFLIILLSLVWQLLKGVVFKNVSCKSGVFKNNLWTEKRGILDVK